jgi:DNA-3-methyladenine glycosylase I
MARRCDWPGEDDLMREYHDLEWGVPVHDDALLFEFLTLESAQAGLSWRTVLHKREGYRAAFADFDPERVARFSAKKIQSLMQNPAIIRNRQKITAAIVNAKAFLAVASEFGSFASYQWSWVDGVPVQNRWRRQSDLPATSKVSDAFSKDLKRRGFQFVGSTVMYAHMQACGMVNDHLVGCFRHAECARPRRKSRARS